MADESMLRDQCMRCEGTGYAPNCTPADRERGDLWECGNCDGTGEVPAPWRRGFTDEQLLFQLRQMSYGYDNDRVIGGSHVRFAVDKVALLQSALADVLGLIDSGYLVRDISHDGEPGWAVKQLEPVRKLANARAVLDGGGHE